MSVAELRRVVHALREPETLRRHRMWWSHFRRVHQAVAKDCHIQRRARQAPPTYSGLHDPVRLPALPALTDVQWAQLYPLLPPQKPPKGRPLVDHRLVVEGILWVIGSGSSWRELPERFGSWSTVASRYQRWCKEGMWSRILQVLLPPAAVFQSSA